MTTLPEIQNQIDRSCKKASRNKADVSLIAVSKTKPVEDISLLYEKGQRTFGENKLQELEEKSPALPSDIEWHFIGRIQRNKIRKILSLSEWVHSVDSVKVLDAVNRIAGEEGHHPKVFLQVNIDEEDSKGGFLSEEIEDAVEKALSLTHLELVGLMCIPSPSDNQEETRASFRKIASLRDQIEQSHQASLPYLSMGMSGDYEIAIEEGATHIRVGSALFGARTYHP